MDLFNLPGDIKVFGFRVTTFPAGIGEAFESLIKMIPGGSGRPYYGISYRDKDGQMVYIAAAQEKYDDEAAKYNCEKYTIQKGEYLGITLYDWRDKTGSINEVFHKIIEDNRADKTKPAVEWYKDDHEMVCMVQTNH